MQAALGGDLGAAALLLSRLWPARKGRPVTVNLPELRTAADLAVAIGAVAHAMARGELTPEEGQAFSAVLELQRRAIELTDIESRLASIEQQQQQRR